MLYGYPLETLPTFLSLIPTPELLGLQLPEASTFTALGTSRCKNSSHPGIQSNTLYPLPDDPSSVLPYPGHTPRKTN